ncbi:MAG: hypothetical protein KatS3mg002_1131 [Candidatus Woesearchaeota archaeon]|nr:MAG: hypothetical protein KatS3mg002_1131 [Candidatus Woesearchaeota archaeon]
MIGTIISLLIIVLCVLLILKVLKGIIIFKIAFKLLSIITIALLIILIIATYYIIKDANDFRKNFLEEKNIIALFNEKTQEITVAFEVNNKTYQQVKDLNFIRDSYKKYEFSNIDDDYYKIFLIKTSALDYLNSIKLQEIETTLTGQELKRILESDTPINEYKQIIKEYETRIRNDKSNTMKNINNRDIDLSDEEFKEYLFSYLITELFYPKNIKILIANIKADNILVYENTIFFKSIRFIPEIFVNDIIKKGNNTVFS